MKQQVFNPFLPLDEYIPDGEPHVFGGRVYLFGSHDREGGTVYCQAGDYVCYSAPVNDLSLWRYDGVIYTAAQHPGGKAKYLYAPDVVKGNDGKYYLYYCLDDSKAGIHVAVCDTPCGKYSYLGYVRNPDGSIFKRFVTGDPAVINDGGTIRLYYGWSLSTMAAFANRGHAFTPEEFKSRLVEGEVRMFGYTKEEILAESGGSVMGAVTCVLADDMRTVIIPPVRIVPGQFLAEGTGFEGHAFYEASSIRKIGKTYYFIYSSMLSNELCYATSEYPDRDFKFRGTIISNGDVGYNGRKAEDRLNQTGNNHGSIEKIGDEWYIFYHRQTNRSTFSRQACAEEIMLSEDGSIPQVEITSCGLNGGALEAEGEYPAAIACNLTNGKMPHITNRAIEEDIPYITCIDNERFIKNISDNTLIGFKYFDFEGNYLLTITVRGEISGSFEIKSDEGKVGTIKISGSREWREYRTHIRIEKVSGLYFVYNGTGKADFLKFALKRT